jgi:hypothetical protein
MRLADLAPCRSCPSINAARVCTASSVFRRSFAPGLGLLAHRGLSAAAGCRAAAASAAAAPGGTRGGGGGSGASGSAAAELAGSDPLIALLEQQAQREPTLHVAPPPERPGPASQPAAPRPSAPPWASLFSDEAEGSGPAASGGSDGIAEGAGQAYRRVPPAQAAFEPMYRRLAAWRARFGACHVPRRCFDAPDLGEWVRWLRKQRVEARLPQWQADRWAGTRAAAQGGARGAVPAEAARPGAADAGAGRHLWARGLPRVGPWCAQPTRGLKLPLQPSPILGLPPSVLAHLRQTHRPLLPVWPAGWTCWDFNGL